MAIEIVDLPIKMVIFHSFLYVYQRVESTGTNWTWSIGKKTKKLAQFWLRPLEATAEGREIDLLLSCEASSDGDGFLDINEETSTCPGTVLRQTLIWY